MPRKNLDLSPSVIKELTLMATESGNKFKPFVEWQLTQIANANKKVRKQTKLSDIEKAMK